MKQKVTTWLQEGANPNRGIQLCTEAGANSFLIRIIKAHPEANKRMMVKYLCDKYGVDKDYSVNWKSLSVNFTPKTKSFKDEFKFLNEFSNNSEIIFYLKFYFLFYYILYYSNDSQLTLFFNFYIIYSEIILSFYHHLKNWYFNLFTLNKPTYDCIK